MLSDTPTEMAPNGALDYFMALQQASTLMELMGVQALSLPHNPVHPNFAVIRLPKGTNVSALYALLCQFGFADVKFTESAEGWQDVVATETSTQTRTNEETQRRRGDQQLPSTVITSASQLNTPTTSSNRTPTSSVSTTTTTITTPTSSMLSTPTSTFLPMPTTITLTKPTLPQLLMQLEVKRESMEQEESDTSPITPGTALSADDIDISPNDDPSSSTSLETIMERMLTMTKEANKQRKPSGFTRCEKCSRLLSTTSGSLISHAISHYPVKRFGCRICGAQFFKKSMYNDHMKNGHPEETTVTAIDLRSGHLNDGQGPIRNEWRRVATECFPNHSHLFKNK